MWSPNPSPDSAASLPRTSGETEARATLEAVAAAVCPSLWAELNLARPDQPAWSAAEIGYLIQSHLPPTDTIQALDRLRVICDRQATELTACRADNQQLRVQLAGLQALAAERGRQLEQRGRGRRFDDAPAAVQASSPPAPPVDAKALLAVPAERLDQLVSVMARTGLARSDALRAWLSEVEGVSPKSAHIGRVIRAALYRGLIEAHPCTVDWPGPKRRAFLVLTPAGRLRAVEMGPVPVPDEYTEGLKLHKTAEHLYLVLYTAQLLEAAGYQDVDARPDGFTVDDGEYCPDILAWENNHPLYVECERSYNKVRIDKWRRAAAANHGRIWLVAPNAQRMRAVLSEIWVATGGTSRVRAFNISEYARGLRGPGGSLWAYRE